MVGAALCVPDFVSSVVCSDLDALRD
jgi:hypothetical protein